jgi:hypothetical protein
VLHVVDLAGSERLYKSNADGLHLREGIHINQSLLGLNKALRCAALRCPKLHIPIRTSRTNAAYRSKRPAGKGRAAACTCTTAVP